MGANLGQMPSFEESTWPTSRLRNQFIFGIFPLTSAFILEPWVMMMGYLNAKKLVCYGPDVFNDCSNKCIASEFKLIPMNLLQIL